MRTSKPPIPAAAPQPSVLSAPPSTPVRRLTQTEQLERRSKGLCFNCDEKFHTGHRCAKKQFLLLLMDDYDEELGSPETEPETITMESATLLLPAPPPSSPSEASSPTSAEHFQLSQAALVGPPSPRTLRVQGRVGELEVTILVDSGSSHNIMQPRLAEFLNLPMVAITPFSVVVGNGASITCSGFCSDVLVNLFGQIFHIPFFILPIHGADLVLGVQWLQTLGAFLSDYSIPSIQFTYNHQPITLTGNTSNQPTMSSFSQYCRYVFTDAIASSHTLSVSQIDAPHHPYTRILHPSSQNSIQSSLPPTAYPQIGHLTITYTFYLTLNPSMCDHTVILNSKRIS